LLQSKKNSKFMVNVFNTHYPLSPEIQHKCSEVLAGFISKRTNGPVVICGDFNSYEGPSKPGSTIPGLMGLTGTSDAHHLVDTPTFGSFQQLTANSHKLDFILYRGLGLLDSGISDYRYGKASLRPSDHSLVHATFKLGSIK
jgi:endonuclease/exonuclease/phosphatase family metal-dependent hydrolase